MAAYRPTPVVAFEMPNTLSVIVLAIIAVVLVAFWVTQFVQLMLLGDGVFPGRFDKILGRSVRAPFSGWAAYISHTEVGAAGRRGVTMRWLS